MTGVGLLAGRPVLAVAASAVMLSLATAVCWAVEPPPVAPTVIAVSGPGLLIRAQMPTRIGCAAATLELTDTAGTPIAHAPLQVQPVQPLMGMAMPPTSTRTDRTGRATTAVCFPMTGPWELHVTAGPTDLTVPIDITG